MRVISINVNGIRSAAKKGFFAWLQNQSADIVCMQETKAQQHQLTETIFNPEGYHVYFCDAQKKGYSGVGIYSKLKPTAVKYGLGWPIADDEGRYLQLDFGKLSVVSLYLPSGTSGDERQTIKYDFLAKYAEILRHQAHDGQSYILCGDWNIAHTKQDIKNWQANQKCSGFLPEERAWLDQVFGPIGFVDAFRHKYPDKVIYTWWSHRARAWENNVGWRIDYQVISQDLADKIQHGSVYRDEKFSDHAPLIMDYNI